MAFCSNSQYLIDWALESRNRSFDCMEPTGDYKGVAMHSLREFMTEGSGSIGRVTVSSSKDRSLARRRAG